MSLTGEKLGPSDTEVRVGWVYQLKKPELITTLEELQLDSNGNVEELRARLVKYYRSREAAAATSIPLPLLPLDIEVRQEKIPIRPPPQDSRERHPPKSDGGMVSATELCDKVRKWGVKFDGTQDPMAFLERIDELRECYGFTEDDLLLALPELLKGKTLLWYRNHKKTSAVPIRPGGRNKKSHSTLSRTSHRICNRYFNVDAKTWEYVQQQPIEKNIRKLAAGVQVLCATTRLQHINRTVGTSGSIRKTATASSARTEIHFQPKGTFCHKTVQSRENFASQYKQFTSRVTGGKLYAGDVEKKGIRSLIVKGSLNVSVQGVAEKTYYLENALVRKTSIASKGASGTFTIYGNKPRSHRVPSLYREITDFT